MMTNECVSLPDSTRRQSSFQRNETSHLEQRTRGKKEKERKGEREGEIQLHETNAHKHVNYNAIDRLDVTNVVVVHIESLESQCRYRVYHKSHAQIRFIPIYYLHDRSSGPYVQHVSTLLRRDFMSQVKCHCLCCLRSVHFLLLFSRSVYGFYLQDESEGERKCSIFRSIANHFRSSFRNDH